LGGFFCVVGGGVFGVFGGWWYLFPPQRFLSPDLSFRPNLRRNTPPPSARRSLLSPSRRMRAFSFSPGRKACRTCASVRATQVPLVCSPREHLFCSEALFSPPCCRDFSGIPLPGCPTPSPNQDSRFPSPSVPPACVEGASSTMSKESSSDLSA